MVQSSTVSPTAQARNVHSGFESGILCINAELIFTSWITMTLLKRIAMGAFASLTPNCAAAASGSALFLTALIAGLAVPEAHGAVISAPRAANVSASASTQQIALQATDLVFDATRSKIYASVASTDPQRPNSIARIDVGSGLIEASVVAGNGPDKLAISSDGQYLYAALENRTVVQRIDLVSFAAGPQFTLGIGWFGEQLRVGDMLVLPGQPGSVAIARLGSFASAGVAIYDDGVQRANTTPASNPRINEIAAASASRLYGIDTESSGSDFSRMTIDATGVTVDDSMGRLFAGDFLYNSGKIFTGYGEVVDPEIPAPIGRFRFASSMVAPDLTNDRVYFLATNSSSLAAYSLSTFRVLGSFDVPGVNGTTASLVKAGDGVFAFRTSSGQVFIARPGSPPAAPACTVPVQSVASSGLAGREYSLNANDLAYDPGRNKLYVSVPGTDPACGNSVVVINLATGAHEATVFVGSEPRKLAISDDGQYLYAALEDAAGVRQISLESLTPGVQFHLGNDRYLGPINVEDMLVLPGQANAVAVARRTQCCGGGTGGVAIYDDGVQRSTTTLTSGRAFIDLILAASGSRLYGFDTYTSGRQFSRLVVDSDGISFADATSEYSIGAGLNVRYDDGKIFTGNGEIFDPELLRSIGDIRGVTGPVAPDTSNDKIYYVSDGDLLTYRLSNLQQIDSVTIPQRAGRVYDLVRLGTGSLAARTDAGEVFVLSLTGAAPPPACASSARSVSAEAIQTRLIALQANDLVYDPLRKKIYASIPGKDPTCGNTVRILDATSGASEGSIYVGSEPNKLAISDDSQYLYVALDGEGAVRRVDLATKSAGLKFYLGRDGSSQLQVGDMLVLPGQPGAVAISRRNPCCSPEDEGIAIYDDGIQRSNLRSTPTGANVIEAASASRLYGYNNETTEFGFRRMAVDANGVSVLDVTEELFSGFGQDFRYEGGKLFGTFGQVVDPEATLRVGTFPNAAGLVVPDTAKNQVHYLKDKTLLTYSLSTFRLLSSVTISGLSGTPNSFIHLGTDALAFSTTGGQLYIAQDDIPSSTASCTVPRASSVSSGLKIALQTNDLAYDPVRKKIYASIPGSHPTCGNTIVSLDAATGAFGASVYVGSEPGRLAISDDGQYLYVALAGSASVRRVDLASLTAGPEFALGMSAGNGPLQVEDLVVLPGQPKVVAISLRNECCSPRHEGVAIYDNGVRRPNSTPGHTGSNVIEVASSSRLYGVNTETSEAGFRRMTVDSNGVTVADVSENLADGDIRYEAGKLFTSSGQLIDPEARRVLGSFPGADGPVAPDVPNDNVYYLTGGQLKTYTISTFRQLETVTISGLSGEPGSLIRLGNGLVAFKTTVGQLFIVGKAKASSTTACSPPKASLATRTNRKLPREVVFTSTVTTKKNCSYDSATLDFGDEQSTPVESGKAVTHDYSSGGQKTVVLTVVPTNGTPVQLTKKIKLR